MKCPNYNKKEPKGNKFIINFIICNKIKNNKLQYVSLPR